MACSVARCARLLRWSCLDAAREGSALSAEDQTGLPEFVASEAFLDDGFPAQSVFASSEVPLRLGIHRFDTSRYF